MIKIFYSRYKYIRYVLFKGNFIYEYRWALFSHNSI